jgi:hypothetical protein
LICIFNYCHQVEAALTTSPEDEELLKLKQDLQEVIELTQELLRSQLAENASKASKVAGKTYFKFGI